MIREKIRYVFVCLLLGILAILYNEYITSVLFLSVIAFPVILWGIMQIVKRHVKVGLLIPERIVRKGEVFKIQIPLENPTILPVLKMQIRMAYQNQYTKRIWHEEVYATMNGKSHQSLEAELKSDYCGNLTVSIEKVFLYDPLGLFRLHKKGEKKVNVTVLPKQYVFESVAVKENPHVMTEGELYSDKRSGDDPSEIFAIREYRYGDRMNRIHWKLTEKEGTLMVKELGMPLNSSVLILVGFPVYAQSMLNTMDAVCSCVFNLSSAFLENEISHYISWNDEETECMRRNKIEKEEELYETMAMLFEARARKEEENALVYHEAEYAKEQYTSIYYITPNLTEEKADVLVRMAKNAWCHIIKIGKIEEKLLAYLESLSVTVAKVMEENLEEDILRMIPQQEEGVQL